MKRRGIIFFVGIMAIIFLSECGSSKKLNRAKRESIRELGAEYLINKLSENELKYETLAVKFKADYIIDKKKTKLKGQFRIKKDSIIWLSITPALGIEILRLYITPDSVKLINRMDKTYLATDFKYINTFLNNAVDFDMLQSLLLGNDFSLYENTHWKARWSEKGYKLSTSNRRKLKKYAKDRNKYSIPIQNIWLEPENYKITHTMIKEIRNQKARKLDVYYSEFLDFDNQRFASNLQFDIQADKNIEVNINYHKISIDDAVRFPFKISKRYTKIEHD